MTSGAERLPERADDQRAHAVGIAESKFGLGRVDIHVDLLRRQRQEQRQHGIAPVRHEIAVGRAHRAGQQLVAHRTAIDREIELKAVRPVQRRQAGKPFDRHLAARGAERQRILDEIGPENAAEPGEAMIEQTRWASFEPEGGALFVGKAEGDLGPRQRQPLHYVGDGGGLDPLSLHEFQSRRCGIEQITHLDPRTGRQGGRLKLGLAAAGDGNFVSLATHPWRRLWMVSLATAPIDGSASPRKPSVMIADKSSSASFEVAWRSTASAEIAGAHA